VSQGGLEGFDGLGGNMGGKGEVLAGRELDQLHNVLAVGEDGSIGAVISLEVLDKFLLAGGKGRCRISRIIHKF